MCYVIRTFSDCLTVSYLTRLPHTISSTVFGYVCPPSFLLREMYAQGIRHDIILSTRRERCVVLSVRFGRFFITLCFSTSFDLVVTSAFPPFFPSVSLHFRTFSPPWKCEREVVWKSVYKLYIRFFLLPALELRLIWSFVPVLLGCKCQDIESSQKPSPVLPVEVLWKWSSTDVASASALVLVQCRYLNPNRLCQKWRLGKRKEAIRG